MRWLRLLPVIAVAGCAPTTRSSGAEGGQEPPPGKVLFDEPFEDTNWEARGWYDGPQMQITSEEHAPGSGHSCAWHWAKAGDVGIEGRGGRVRFEPVTNVTLSFSIKHCDDWTWTGVNWHPHEFHFVTDVDPAYIGPAHTHLTLYVEAVNGRPRVGIQDGMNIDETRVGQNLVGVTEKRAVAGGNGDSDGYGGGDCYKAGDHHANGKSWEPNEMYFTDEKGPHYKGDWHRIRVKFQLNTVKDGVGQKDGIIRYWYDGQLIMDYHGIVFRTGQHPTMKINQFLMAPYYGPGVPHEQTIWVDDLRITTEVP
jgi:hypothetical protein